jgi:hypothetical protein
MKTNRSALLPPTIQAAHRLRQCLCIFRLKRERVGSGSLTDGAATIVLVGERNSNIARKTDSPAQ